MKTTAAYSLNPELVDQVREYARIEGRSASGAANYLLAFALEQKMKNNRTV